MRSREVISRTDSSMICTSLYLHRFIDRLIHPVPDTTTDSTVRVLHVIPIFLEVTDSITHRMSILTKEHRLVKIVGILFHPIHIRIHLRIQVAGHMSTIRITRTCSLIMHRARIKTLRLLITCCEIISSATLITKAPHHHTSMISVAGNQSCNSVHECRDPRLHI